MATSPHGKWSDYLSLVFLLSFLVMPVTVLDGNLSRSDEVILFCSAMLGGLAFWILLIARINYYVKRHNNRRAGKAIPQGALEDE